jgi:hypothetical protein
MNHRVDCECGDGVTVEETAAGTTVLCRCGRGVVIPSLRELRRRAGRAEPAVSQDLAVESLLLAGKLPEEDHCVLCGVATDTYLCYRTECERARVEGPRPARWTYLPAFLAFGWLGAIGIAVARSKARDSQEWGEDRIYSLPLRICGPCGEGLTDPTKVKAALRRVPLYRRLLEKYPQARVSLPDS